MQKPDTSIIDQPWTESELEHVDACPYCGTKERTLAYKDVQDWSFYCAPGKWTYWDCKGCEALYLSPRPKEASIGKAYGSYYTHGSSEGSLKQRIKTQLKNECFSHWINYNITPRLNLPKSLGFLLNPLKKILYVPFELEQLDVLPKGKLLDVGCGNGNMLKLAKELGWDVTGLEIDPNAVKAARERGLNVIEGDYRKLHQFVDGYDCIICSHVLEHVHQPLILLRLLVEALKPQGVLFLSLPNAKSHVRAQFGENWRGLEAPRHVAIPTLKKSIELLNFLGCTVISQVTAYDITIYESVRIKEKKSSLSRLDFIYLKLKNALIRKSLDTQSDFIQLVLRKERL
jgi:2-polyprenyl-3-methyl-5-hydroxy-6-metoxy-1,4-benzoquinol methylase